MVTMLKRLTAVLATAALAALGLVGLTAAPAAAEEETVANEAELRDAFADPGVTSIVLQGDIDLEDCGEELSRDSDNNLVVDGAGHTIGQTCDNLRVMGVDGDGALTLRHITLTGGSVAADGGAVLVRGDVAVVNSTLHHNEASGNGGAISSGGHVTVTNSTLHSNTAGSDGGAISAAGGATITGSQFHQNEVTGNSLGGAISAGAPTTVTASAFVDNHAEFGGAIYIFGASDDPGVEIVDSQFVRNTARDQGGAIDTSLDILIRGSTFEDNRADLYGGAFAQASADTHFTVINSTFSGNRAAERGGLAYVPGSSGTIRHITAVGNQVGDAGHEGAHWRFSAGSITVSGSVIAGPIGGPNCFLDGEATVVSEGHNVTDDDSCGFTHPTDTETGADLQLGALADNGGLTDTMLPAGDSPLIDAIPAGDCHPEVGTDQRGVERPQGEGCDIGAVEVTTTDDDPTDPVTDPSDPGTDPTDPGAGDSLADTGSRTVLVLAAAALLLAVGAGLVVTGRRRGYTTT